MGLLTVGITTLKIYAPVAVNPPHKTCKAGQASNSKYRTQQQAAPQETTAPYHPASPWNKGVTPGNFSPGQQVEFRNPGTNTWRKGGTIAECSEATGRCRVESWSEILHTPSDRGDFEAQDLRFPGGQAGGAAEPQ